MWIFYDDSIFSWAENIECFFFKVYIKLINQCLSGNASTITPNYFLVLLISNTRK